jgi:REP element-mobilizing transposase RayT
MPMIAAYHLIWTIYGAWLPNDPRGSGSHEVRTPVLQDLGELHLGRKKAQPCSAIIRKFYSEAKPRLKFDVVPFDESEILSVAAAIRDTIAVRRYTCYACAIMPDHVHILIRKHKDLGEEMIAHLQDESWQRVIRSGRRPSTHPVWTNGGGWKVYLETREDIERTIRYIERNPDEAQAWDFVQKYDGWLPGGRSRK